MSQQPASRSDEGLSRAQIADLIRTGRVKIETPYGSRLNPNLISAVIVLALSETRAAVSEQQPSEPVAWIYESVGSETITRQPPDRVVNLSAYKITPLYERNSQ